METLLNNKAAMIGLAVLAFLVAALLVLAIVRMLFGGRLRMPGARARQARLGIVDAFDLDRQRQLIIVRRDNTEHLIMIGGPNDVLIESEIVRVEARDLRDARRDKPADALIQAPGFGAPSPGASGFNEARIPAPSAVERAAPPFTAVPPSLAPSASVPAPPPMPPSMPEIAPSIEPVLAAPSPAAVAPPRAPTFPLPPRRPAPSPPERRPAPPPPRLPDSVTRTDDVAPAPTPGAGAAPLPSSIVPPPAVPPVLPDVPFEGLSVADPAAPLVVPAPRPAPPLLKPRPPIRPLQRTTPQPFARPPFGQAPSVAPADPAAQPMPQPAQPMPQPAPTQPVVPPPAIAPVAVSPPPPAPPPEADPKDALESLEEEMAKLLGRGPAG